MADDSHGKYEAADGSAENHDEDDQVQAGSGRQVALPGMLASGSHNGYDADGVRARALTYGTKAVAVSSNKQLTSKFRGVCWNKKNKRWQAAINSSGKYLYLGSYDTEAEAAAIFDKAAIRIRGLKARLNFCYSDYVDADGKIQHDAAIDELLSDAANPSKPRRQRAGGSGGGGGAAAGGSEAASHPRPRQLARTASTQSASEGTAEDDSPPPPQPQPVGRGRRRRRGEADGEDANASDGGAAPSRPRQRRPAAGDGRAEATVAAAGAAADSQRGHRGGAAPTGSAMTMAGPAESGADGDGIAGSSGGMGSGGAGHGAGGGIGSGACRSYGLAADGAGTPNAAAAAAAAMFMGAMAGIDNGGSGALGGVELGLDQLGQQFGWGGGNGAGMHERLRLHPRAASAQQQLRALNSLEQLAIAQQLSGAAATAPSGGQQHAAAAAAAHLQAVRLGSLGSLGPELEQEQEPLLFLHPDAQQQLKASAAAAAAAQLQQAREEALAGLQDGLGSGGGGGYGHPQLGGAAGALPLHQAGVPFRLSQSDQASLALARLRSSHLARGASGALGLGLGLAPSAAAVGAGRPGLRAPLGYDDEGVHGTAVYTLHQLAGASGADELARLLGGGGGLHAAPLDLSPQLQPQLGLGGRGGLDGGPAGRQASVLHSLQLQPPQQQQQHHHGGQHYGAAGGGGGGAAAAQRQLSGSLRLQGRAAAAAAAPQAFSPGSVLQHQLQQHPPAQTLSRPLLGPGGKLTLLLHPDPDSDLALTDVASALGLSLRGGVGGGEEADGGGFSGSGGTAPRQQHQQQSVDHRVHQVQHALNHALQHQQQYHHQQFASAPAAAARSGDGGTAAAAALRREPSSGHAADAQRLNHQHLQQIASPQQPAARAPPAPSQQQQQHDDADTRKRGTCGAPAFQGSSARSDAEGAARANRTCPPQDVSAAAVQSAGPARHGGGPSGAAAATAAAETSMEANARGQGSGAAAIAAAGGGGDLFSLILRALPSGSALDAVIPSQIPSVVGVLYRTEAAAAAAARDGGYGGGGGGSSEMCAAVWNGRVHRLRQLGTFASEDRAKASCQAALAILLDNESVAAPHGGGVASAGPGTEASGGGAHWASPSGGGGGGGGGLSQASGGAASPGHSQGAGAPGGRRGSASRRSGAGAAQYGLDPAAADGVGGDATAAAPTAARRGHPADVALDSGSAVGGNCSAYKLVLPAGADGVSLSKLNGLQLLADPEHAAAAAASGQRQLLAIALPPHHAGMGNGGGGAGGGGAAATLSLDSLAYRLQPLLFSSVGTCGGGRMPASAGRPSLGLAAACSQPDPFAGGDGDASRGSAAATNSSFRGIHGGGGGGGSAPSPAPVLLAMGMNAADGELTDESAVTDRPVGRSASATGTTLGVDPAAVGGGGGGMRVIPLSVARNAAAGMLAGGGDGAAYHFTTLAYDRGGGVSASRGSSGRRESSLAHGGDDGAGQHDSPEPKGVTSDAAVAARLRGGGNGGGSSLTSEFAALTQLANVDVQEALQLFFQQHQHQQAQR